MSCMRSRQYIDTWTEDKAPGGKNAIHLRNAWITSLLSLIGDSVYSSKKQLKQYLLFMACALVGCLDHIQHTGTRRMCYTSKIKFTREKKCVCVCVWKERGIFQLQILHFPNFFSLITCFILDRIANLQPIKQMTGSQEGLNKTSGFPGCLRQQRWVRGWLVGCVQLDESHVVQAYSKPRAVMINKTGNWGLYIFVGVEI